MLWKIWNILLLKHRISWNDSCVSDERYHVYRSWGCVGPNHLRSIPWIKNHEQSCQINPNNLLETMGRVLYASDSFTIHYSFDWMILNDPLVCNWYEMCRSTTNQKIQNTKPSPRDPSKIPTIQKFHIGLWQTKLWKLNAEYLVIETILRENQN